jgi:hypothetical protein
LKLCDLSLFFLHDQFRRARAHYFDLIGELLVGR